MKTNSKLECILLIITVVVMGNFWSFAQPVLNVLVNGEDSADFEKHIKSVTISMKKTHQNGDITYDEVQIDQKNIIREGDYFKLSFLRKGEEDNAKWLDYQYKTSWSFFGGHNLETEWVNSSRKNIVLTSPFAQRELVAIVEAANITDIGNSIKSVTVTMKKIHENGSITNDEVRIDRKKIIREGNNFKLLYGKKGDENLAKWRNYEYQITWSYFGGYTFQTKWIKAERMVIMLVPPLVQKTINIEADPETVAKYGIRAIHVKVYYLLGDKELTKRMTFKKDEPFKTLDILLPNNVDDFEYEINWKLKGNKRKSSGRIKTNSSYLFIDELPKE